MTLSDIIIGKINAGGPLSFYDYMEMCLYHPAMGYYTSLSDKIGVQGDYYTGPTLSTVFGASIGRQIEEMWEALGRVPFTIVEYGAGTGMLCHDILSYLKGNSQLYEGLRYCIIERSESMREKEKSQLREKVSWHDSIAEISPVTGCIISNELLDNFAVHQVVMGSEPEEITVDYKNGFVEVLRPAPDDVKEYLDELDIHLPKGFRTEINTDAKEWIQDVSDALERGYVLTIDYGYPSSELYKPYRRYGTLLCYYRHKVNTNPYINIGEQDITSFVNFSALCHWGSKNGLSCYGYTDQAHFLLDLGLDEHLAKMRNDSQHPLPIRQELILKHILVEDMGRKFKVLIQGKGTDANRISGIRSAQDTII